MDWLRFADSVVMAFLMFSVYGFCFKTSVVSFFLFCLLPIYVTSFIHNFIFFPQHVWMFFNYFKLHSSLLTVKCLL